MVGRRDWGRGVAPDGKIGGEVWHLMMRLRVTARVIDGTMAPNDDWAKEPVGWRHPTATHAHEMGGTEGEENDELE